MKEIDLQTARRFILDCQGLLDTSTSTKSVIELLGYIQIDTISVINRAHHHVIWNRNPRYLASDIQHLIETKQIFEYWAHAAAYLPMKHFRFSLYPKYLIAKGSGHWHKKDEDLMKQVLAEFQKRGPLQARQFVKESDRSTSIPWLQHPINRAIRQLYMEGKIMISGRKGFQKVYDLTERVIPDIKQIPIPSRSEYLDYLLKRDLKAHGLLTLKELGYLLPIKKSEWSLFINQKIKEKQLFRIRISELSNDYFCLIEFQEKLNSPRQKSKKMHLLSPFDNLIIQRDRLSRIFDFNYTLECYVPSKKRIVGYFSLPILWGTQFIGQIDLKAHRKEKILEVKNLIWENKNRIPEATFHKTMHRFMRFNHCETIKWK